MKNCYIKSILFIIFLHICTLAAAEKKVLPEQTYNLCFKNILVDHRFDMHRLEIVLSFSNILAINKAGQNFSPEKLRQTVLHFIQNYPDKSSYWEILNKNLVLHVTQNFPYLDAFTSKIKIFASSSKPHDRWTQVHYENNQAMKESFGFDFELSPQQNASISFEYCTDIKSENYPNFFEIKKDFERLFQLHNSSFYPQTILQRCAEELLLLYPSVNTFQIHFRSSLHKDATRDDFFEWSILANREAPFLMTIQSSDGIEEPEQNSEKE